MMAVLPVKLRAPAKVVSRMKPAVKVVVAAQGRPSHRCGGVVTRLEQGRVHG
jgi:hypothetical protein